MVQTLAALWNGNLSPVRHLGENNAELRHLEELIKRNTDLLEAQLNDMQKNRWESYFMCIEEYLSLMTEQAFCDGFCLGTKLTTEALGGAKKFE